ncbi:MAG: hypothetical protein US63_C0009G0009 [Candidatus Moranbacteria bacterium GW2011_GWC2_37_8]|nr:MAG: hypothetical protein US63_C0009G0009 [Candidatus Moranbacteria bacterium GW2011_GWC2_37_8]KKQ62261.1 MAG: hypothetical protein US82_C0016G0009 [Parcubacteria group bacterium GW2011_GWC1_38_22]KKQ81015.1 MAG: hypothetical protein UT03_C0014G0010 [Candidatus Moranbacteria bacterium GW2011_GWD2_38_7]
MNENIQAGNETRVEKKEPSYEDIYDGKQYFTGESRELAKMKAMQEIGDEVGTERVRDLLNSIPDENSDKLFSANEKFDPWAEMKNIRTGTREENKDRLDLFKKKMAYQKIGMIEMQSILYDEINKKPRVTEDELEAKISELMNKYALSDHQRDIFEKSIEIYIERHNGITNYTKECLAKHGEISGKKLFEEMFKRAPYGRVDVVIKPMTLYLKMHNIKDYAYVESGAYMEGRDADKNEIKAANRSGGTKLGNSHIPGLEHTVAIENASSLAARIFWERSRKILTHEDQHNFNQLIDDALSGNSNEGLNPAGIEPPLIETQNDRELSDFDISLSVQNEICAYVKDGSDAESIRNYLLKRDTIYTYGEKYKKENKKNGEKFSQDYIDLVEGGIVAVFDLIKHGYSREEANALLYTENIFYWGNVVEKQLGKRKSIKQELKDKKKLTSLRGRIKRLFF